MLQIWTELRLRHTLLASWVEFDDYEDIRFGHIPPATLKEATEQASTAFGFKYEVTKDYILDSYLNGPRTLSDDKLAALFITTERPELDLERLTVKEGEEEEDVEFHFWLFATHFLGDGMALHTTANEFFELLGGGFEAAKDAGTLQWNADEHVVSILTLSNPKLTSHHL